MATHGRKDDQEKPDMDLLSPHALEKIAQVMTFGKKKYGRDNWRGGIVYSRLLAAVLRHINSYRKGESLDPETGLSHLSHASCGLMMLLEFEETRPDLDDRSLGKPDKEEIKKTLEFPTTTTSKKIAENSYLCWEVKFQVGDVVKHISNDVEVTVEGTYFDKQGKPILFVKDSDNKIFGVDPSFYRGIYVEREKDAGN